jgi:hypothetical protein
MLQLLITADNTSNVGSHVLRDAILTRLFYLLLNLQLYLLAKIKRKIRENKNVQIKIC